jgi:GTP cyclohydrolase I
MNSVPLRELLPDHASHADDRGIPIDRVGIRGLRWPVTVWDRAHRAQSVVAEIDATVGLPGDVKGTHMSRFVEVLSGVRGELSLHTLPDLCEQLQGRLGADAVQLDVRFPYFMERLAPVSRVPSLMEYGAAFHATRTGDVFDFVLEVRVPVTTLCPCSKAVSERGAHNQRSYVDVEVRGVDFLWIEDVVEAVEACASSPLYALLKREDEKWVTEHAYDNPRFVEDLIREVTASLRPKARSLRVTVENVESIHNHSAWARLEWTGAPAEAAPSVEPRSERPPRTAEPFGEWLAGRRAALHLTQAQLAERLAVSESLVCKLESGRRGLAPEHVLALATALGEAPERLAARAGVLTPAQLDRVRADPEGFLRWVGTAS